jgi:hypothetical protein
VVSQGSAARTCSDDDHVVKTAVHEVNPPFAPQKMLVEKVCQLGWAKEQVIVIDEDLGRSGSGWVERSGFAHLTTEVAMAARESCSDWKSPAWHATMPTGIACSICAA